MSSGEDDGDAGHHDPEDPAAIRLAAMNLLARREHSLAELRLKLSRRFDDKECVETQLQRLAEENLQSDSRFAGSFVRQRINRGQGPVRIRAEMRQQQIPDDAIEAALAQEAADWSQLAGEVLSRKFGAEPPGDLKDRARRIRFLQYRGFEPDHYQALLRG